MKRALVLIAKEPGGGNAKTRLAGAFGREGSAALAEAMLLDSCERLVEIAPADCDLIVYHDPPDAAERLAALGIDARFTYLAQCTGTLGDRLAHAADELADYDGISIIAADAPHALGDVLDTLPRTPDEITLAPCDDGGYWAVGLARPAPIFAITMSTEDVLSETIAAAEAAARPVRLVPSALDLDLPDDLSAAETRAVLSEAPRTRETWLRLRERVR